MATRLLCCVALCLLGVEPTTAGVTQTPRHVVTKKGEHVTLLCERISEHTYLYWYRQSSLQGPQFLASFRNKEPLDKSGLPQERFSARMLSESLSSLEIEPAEPGDSALFLCASSSATALQSRGLAVHKASPPPPQAPGESSCPSRGEMSVPGA